MRRVLVISILLYLSTDKNTFLINGQITPDIRAQITVNLPKIDFFPVARIPSVIELNHVRLEDQTLVEILGGSQYMLSNKIRVKIDHLEQKLAALLKTSLHKIVLISCRPDVPFETLVEAIGSAIRANASLIGFVSGTNQYSKPVWVQLMPQIVKDVSDHIISITANGHYFYSRESISLDSLMQKLDHKKNIMKSASVLVFNVDRKSALSHFSSALEVCQKIGINEAYLLVDVIRDGM